MIFLEGKNIPQRVEELTKFIKNVHYLRGLGEANQLYLKLYWRWISTNISLDEEIIEIFEELVDWKAISQYQNLSEGFIVAHSDKLDKDLVKKYQHYGSSFVDPYPGN